MPRSKRQKQVVFDEELSSKVAHDPDPIDPSDEELDEVFTEFPQHEACIELYRTTEKGGKPAFLNDIMPSDFSFGFVCQEYGGGNYIVKGKYKDGTTIKRSFVIEGSPYPVKRKAPQGDTHTAAMPVAPAPALSMEGARREDGSYDMAAVIGSMMNMMKGMIAESKGSKAEWLSEMQQMRQLFGGADKPQTPIHEAIGMIKTGIELGSTANAGEGGIPWMLIIDKLQGPLTEIVSTIKHAVTQPPRTVGTPIGVSGPPVPNPPAPPPPQGDPQSMEMMLLAALKGLLPMLVTGAAQKTDPGFYADLLLDQIPRQFYTTAKIWLEKPDCIEQLSKMNLSVAHERLWFDSLKKELLAALTEEMGEHAARSVQPQPPFDTATNGSADL